MTQHTPGPWKIEVMDDGSERITGGENQDLIAVPTGGRVGKANARLIAQAPALLAELKDMMDFLLGGDFGAHDNEQFVIDARKIIRDCEEEPR